MMDGQTLEQVLLDVRTALAELYGRNEAEGFVRIIFRNLLHYETVDILLRKDTILPEFVVEKIRKVVDELLAGKPIQYIFGTARFHGHEFVVDESVLIPRPETEELVDMIVDENRRPDLKVLDAGTGSGCIAVSLALALKFADVRAIDLSERALAVAERNAKTLKAKVAFGRADILRLEADAPEYDLIVSNPPYVTESEKRGMDRNVLEHEPLSALFVPDQDPLVFYRALARYGQSALKPGGRLYFEINSLFPQEMRRLLEDAGYAEVEIRRDMQAACRFAVARKGEER